MASTSVPTSPKEATTRIERALRLFEEHGTEIEKVASGVFLVPSEASPGEHYRVDYRNETCSCPDATYHPEETCKHVYAIGILAAKRRRRQSFDCDGCGTRTPQRDGHDVHPEHGVGIFEEGMRICTECARYAGVAPRRAASGGGFLTDDDEYV